MTHILLAGATGLIGSHVLTLLLADERVTQVVAQTRQPLGPHAKMRNPIHDSGSLPLDASWWDVDGAICTLGTTRAKAGSSAAFRAIDFDYALAVAKAARQGGARRFALVSSMGADAKSPFLYPRTKGEVENAIRDLGFPSLTIIRPGFLGGHRQETRPMEYVLGKMLGFAAPVLPAFARVSPAVTVASLLVDAAVVGQDGVHVVTSAEIAGAAA